MDLWGMSMKTTTTTTTNPFSVFKGLIHEKPSSFNLAKVGVFNEMKFSSSRRYLSFVVRTSNNNSSSSSSPADDEWSFTEGDIFTGDNSNPENSTDSLARKAQRINLDWREFRANLLRQENAEKAKSEGHNLGEPSLEIKPLGSTWAHPIIVPETGCVLVATEKLDGVRAFERTVVLLLRLGTRHPQQGPFGVVINRPLHKKMKHMKPTNHELATTFGDCSLHFGGPLDASTFLLKTGERQKPKLLRFEEAIPGLCFGARFGLEKAAALVKRGIVKPQDFRFFIGYAGWQLDQLIEEVDSGYWHVAACSSNLLSGVSSSENLWEEILQLMGGPYSELSRKPKEDLQE
ncbi:hypothetical protein ACFE04_004520 [Oxalis oulophora]